MRCLCRPSGACFFLSDRSLSLLFHSPSERSPVLFHRKRRMLRIRGLLSAVALGNCCSHASNRAGQGLWRCRSLPGSQNRTQALTGPNSFFLPRTSLPSPFRGRGWVSTFLGSPGLPCSFKTDSHWPNRAGIEPRWCPLPSSQNRTQGHTGGTAEAIGFCRQSIF